MSHDARSQNHTAIEFDLEVRCHHNSLGACLRVDHDTVGRLSPFPAVSPGQRRRDLHYLGCIHVLHSACSLPID